MPGVVENFKTIINEMTHGTNLKLVNLLLAENANLTHENQNTSIHEPEHGWNIHLVSYDTLTSRAKPSSNGQLSQCSWSLGIFDESHWSRTKNSIGWRIAMNAAIGFELRVTAVQGFHSLYDWCFQTMWLFSRVPENSEDETVMEMHGADVLHSPAKSLMHAIRTKDEHAHQHAAHQMIQIPKL
jgi:hypothetical protein